MATVVSVNAGLSPDVEWQGKTIRTAIPRRPLSAGRQPAFTRIYPPLRDLTEIGADPSQITRCGLRQICARPPGRIVHPVGEVKCG